MSGQLLLGYAPLAALTVGLLTIALVVRHGLRQAQLGKRPVLLGALLLSALPGLYVGLNWARVLPESYVRFGKPWAAIVGFVAMAFVAIRLAQHGKRGSRTRSLLSDFLVGAAVLASALAATEPQLGRPMDRMAIIAVIDRSRSIDLVASAERRVKRELAAAEHSMREDDRIGTVVFGSEAANEEPPRPKTTTPSPQRVDIGRDGTDIAAGLKRALADVPPDAAARLVLISDGGATRGDVMSAAAAALAAEIPIDVLPLEQRDMADVRVVSFSAPTHATEKETLGMRVVIASPQATQVEVRISQNGALVDAFTTKVKAGETVVGRELEASKPGLHRYDVAISAVDKRLDENVEDNTASAFVRVRGQARALVIDGYGTAKTEFIAASLRDAKFVVDVGTASAVPGDIGHMARFDLIVLSDVPAHHLAPGQIEAMASYVRDLGGGLLLVGGDRSFGPGGYARTPLEEISPVSFDLKQERRRASLAEVIIIDISGSMAMRVGAHSKLELANEAAARSASLLGAGDHLGVLHVDTRPMWSVPLGPVTDKKAIDTAIRSVGPGGGGIYVDVSMDEAYPALRRAQVNLKHVLLFADGNDAERISPAVQNQVAAAHRSGITTSCVALGRGRHVPDLEEMSRRGGGRFYIVEDATRLPAVFAQETILAARSALVERSFRAAPGIGSPIMIGVDLAKAPALEGYVVTIAKARADVLLPAPESDPLLAVWQAGLGRAAVFTSDLKNRWGSAWTHWQGGARLLAQTARHVVRRQDERNVQLEASVSAGELHLRATVVGDDGRLQSFLRLQSSVRGPGGFKRDLPLDAAGPGIYTASLPITQPGAYIAVARDELRGRIVATTGAVLTKGEELRPSGTDFSTLERIAELTGGKRRDTIAGIFRDRAARRFAYQDITVVLLFIAAIALLLAIGARRLAVPEIVSKWVSKMVRWRPWTAAGLEEAATAGGPSATLASLLETRQQQRAESRSSETQAAEPAKPTKPAEPAEPANTMERLSRRKRQPASVESTPARPEERLVQPPIARATPPRAQQAAVPPPPPAPAPQPATGKQTGDDQPPRTAAEILAARRKKRRPR